MKVVKMLMNSIYKNKRGDISTLVLVFLTVFLCSMTLFIFITNSSFANVRVYDTGYITNVYNQEQLLNYYIGSAGDTVISNIDKTLTGEQLRIEFESKFKEEFSKYSTGINNNDFSIEVVEKKITVTLNKVELESSKIDEKTEMELMKVTYYPKIVVTFGINWK